MRKILVTSLVPTTFFLSGGCGMVYAGLWSRYLAELTGSPQLAEHMVLLLCMGGMGLGAILVGRRVDRHDNALIVYGGLAIGTGLYALLFPLLFKMLAYFYCQVGSRLASGSAVLDFLQILLALLLLIVPSMAMGGTLPAVIRHLSKRDEKLRGDLSLLYGLYSLGAGVGLLASGLFWVYRFGFDLCMHYAGASNLIIGLGVLFFARFSAFSMRPASGGAADALFVRRVGENLDGKIYDLPTVRRALIFAGLSGFITLALQVAWYRYFVIELGASQSLFTMVMSGFFCGIGMGALLARSRLVGRLPLSQLLVGLSALLTFTLGAGLLFYGRIPFETVRLLSLIAPVPLGWPYFQGLKFSICFILMVLPTATAGMILPVCARIATRGHERVGRDIALVSAVNSLGALLGIALTYQLFFRFLSLSHTLWLILLISSGSTAYLAWALAGNRRRIIVGGSALVALSNLLLLPLWSSEQLYVSQLDFMQLPPLDYQRFSKSNENKVVVDERQGPVALVTVLEDLVENRPIRTLIVNGQPEALISRDRDGKGRAAQLMLADLPGLLHPAPADILVLGVGTGITSGEFLQFPEVRKLTTAEPIWEVFEAAKIFEADNNRFWDNPRHRLVIEDAKSFLRLSSEKFDVITIQGGNTLYGGMSDQYSEEFYRIVKERLTPGGLVAQGLKIARFDDRTVNIVLRTFSRFFPTASIFMISTEEILLVGYDQQWRFDPGNMDRRFDQPQIKATLKRMGNLNPTALLLREVMSRASFRDYTTALTIPVNTSNLPILEEAAEYGQFINEPVTVFQQHDSRVDPDGQDLLVGEYSLRFPLNQKVLDAVVDSSVVDDTDKLRQSLNFRRLAELWKGGQAGPPLAALASIDDPQLREIITHPYYRMDPDRLGANDAFNLLGAELLLWGKTASQLWTPEPKRLQELYDRFAAQVGDGDSGRVARNAALALARGRACRTALPFFRIAEARGQLVPDRLAPAEIATVFACEVKVGEPEKARRWWQVIEQGQLEVTEEMQLNKTSLDIKLGGVAPPVYGSLPSLGD